MQKLMTSTTKEQEGLLKIHANLFMYTNTLVPTCIKSYREEWKTKLCMFAVTCCSVPVGQEWEVVSISRSAHLQGRQWVDMNGLSEGSKDKGEV